MQSVEHHSELTAYVKSSAFDESIGGPLQCWPVAGLKDSLEILPQANLGNNWILCGLLVAKLGKQMPLTYPEEVVSVERCIFLFFFLVSELQGELHQILILFAHRSLCCVAIHDGRVSTGSQC